MLAEERFGQILNLLSKQRTATVQELCEALGTSESTIRRDLTELDRLGKLNKVHGGATLPDSRFQAEEPTMQAKETLAVPQKRAIAAAAAASSTPRTLCSSTQAPPRWNWCGCWRARPCRQTM